jgi:hypothetical protein
MFITSLVTDCYPSLPANGVITAPPQSGWQITNGGRSYRMSSTEQKFMKTAELVRLARVKSVETIAEQFRQSLPIPVVYSDGLCVLFLYCPALALPRQPVKMNPPHYLVRLNASTGALEEVRPATAKEFGQTHGPADLIGTFAMPQGMTVQEFMQKLDRLYKVYDALLPEFAARSAAVSQEAKTAAREFAQLFELLSEPPLRPYYRAAGKGFFPWIDQASR